MHLSDLADNELPSKRGYAADVCGKIRNTRIEDESEQDSGIAIDAPQRVAAKDFPESELDRPAVRP